MCLPLLSKRTDRILRVATTALLAELVPSPSDFAVCKQGGLDMTYLVVYH